MPLMAISSLAVNPTDDLAEIEAVLDGIGRRLIIEAKQRYPMPTAAVAAGPAATRA